MNPMLFLEQAQHSSKQASKQARSGQHVRKQSLTDRSTRLAEEGKKSRSCDGEQAIGKTHFIS